MSEDLPMPENPEPPPAPSPRAFAQGVGLLLQAAGVILFLCSSCLCALAGLWDPSLAPPATASDGPRGVVTLSTLVHHPAAAGAMGTVMTATLAGLAMTGFGLGLQADRRYAPLGAVITTVLGTALLLAAATGLWIGAATWTMRLWNFVLIVLFTVLSVFTIAAWRQVRAAPPPDNVDIVPPGQKIPYSWYHDDPPDVRLEHEIAERRARLAEEQRELDRMQSELENQRRDPQDS